MKSARRMCLNRRGEVNLIYKVIQAVEFCPQNGHDDLFASLSPKDDRSSAKVPPLISSSFLTDHRGKALYNDVPFIWREPWQGEGGGDGRCSMRPIRPWVVFRGFGVQEPAEMEVRGRCTCPEPTLAVSR
jgi:hypothetical protein